MAGDLTYKLYIDGAWVDGEGDDTVDVIGRVPQATRGDVRRAITAARRAFDEGPWPRMSVRERSALLVKMAEVMERRFPELIDLNMREAGSTRALAQTIQVGIPLAAFRHTVDEVLTTYKFETSLPPSFGMGIGQGVVLKEPVGVAALISAYNFPFFLNMFKIAPALAAGNTAVLKPAPTTPLEAFIIAEFAEEAGLPPGVLNIVTGDVDAGLELTTNAMVDMISFTGSDAV